MKREFHVGALPQGYAALEAEALEVPHQLDFKAAAPLLGETAVQTVLETEEEFDN